MQTQLQSKNLFFPSTEFQIFILFPFLMVITEHMVITDQHLLSEETFVIGSFLSRGEILIHSKLLLIQIINYLIASIKLILSLPAVVTWGTYKITTPVLQFCYMRVMVSVSRSVSLFLSHFLNTVHVMQTHSCHSQPGTQIPIDSKPGQITSSEMTPGHEQAPSFLPSFFPSLPLLPFEGCHWLSKARLY